MSGSNLINSLVFDGQRQCIGGEAILYPFVLSNSIILRNFAAKIDNICDYILLNMAH